MQNRSNRSPLLASILQVGGLAALLSGCAVQPVSDESAVGEAQSAESSNDCGEDHGVPVIFDTDMDFDDSAALAYLAAEHKMGHIDLRAVTVTNNGAGFPGEAIQHARCLLAQFGLSNIPVADNTATGPKQFPIELRGAASVVLGQTLAGCTESAASSSVHAEKLLLDTVRNSHDPVTIVTTGPTTNLAAALALSGSQGSQARQRFVDNVDRVFIMGGAVHVAGNVTPTDTEDGSQEYNIWGDQAAATTIFQTFDDVYLVALDATQHVPVTVAFSNRIAGDHHTPEADYVYSLTSNPLIAGAVQANLGFYWWDPLDAVASSTSSVVTYETDQIAITTSGLQNGRTAIVSRHQGSRIKVGVNANAAAFENVFIDTLNHRASNQGHH